MKPQPPFTIQSPFKQLLFLTSLFVCCLLASGLIGALLNRLFQPADPLSTLYLVQNISAAGSFLLPAWLFARRIAPGNARLYLGGIRTTWPACALGLAALIALIPWINATTTWNLEFLQPWRHSEIGRFFQQLSDSNEQLLQLFLSRTDYGHFLLNLVTLALMPAICEEVFFRGCLQTYLTSLTARPHTGIWLTAFIFSLLHFDPAGFLPRLFLGALLGYVFAAGRSLYPGILLHFVNNASVVVAYFLYHHGRIPRHPESFSDDWHWWSATLGLLLATACIVHLFRSPGCKPASPIQAGPSE